MNKLSATIITLNEEENIGACLESLAGVADEIVIVDSFSRDKTEEICRRFTDRFHQMPWEGFRDTKQRATDLATNDWILSLDADERLSPGLQDEIRAWKGTDPDFPGYRVARLTRFMGRWIRHTSWYPDWQLRLFDRRTGRWGGGRVHESFRIEGEVARLQEPLLHHTYASISEYLRKLDRFSSLAAADAFDRGKRSSIYHLSLYPPVVFFRNYLLKRGFLDGTPGLVVSALAATSTFFKQLKLFEMQRTAREEEDED